MKRTFFYGLALSVGTFSSLQADAATITNGFTFSVASGSDTSTGTHFHSSTGGDFGNPAGKAEVGRFDSEEVRGLSEYNLAGLLTSASAFVTFDVSNNGGLFAGTNDFPFIGNISVESYQGNNTEDLDDYASASVANIGSFSTSTISVGDTLSFDITSLFNGSITTGSSSLGIRLRADPLNANGGAWTFDQFNLTTDNQTTISPVPLPASLPIMFSCIIALSSLIRRKKSTGKS